MSFRPSILDPLILLANGYIRLEKNVKLVILLTKSHAASPRSLVRSGTYRRSHNKGYEVMSHQCISYHKHEPSPEGDSSLGCRSRGPVDT